jgi:histidyl-tRNA synthetase
MSSKVQAIRGTQDMLGETAERFHSVVATFERVRRLYGFQRVEIPIFEATQVFTRSVGETTDIVSKEIYSFEDRSGESLTLRPEFTAGIARAFISEGWQQLAPLKVVTHGPLFRYERPQKGRYRQFHQLDAEILGADSPAADVDLLVFADQLLRELGVSDGVTLQLNTLGDSESRIAWRAALVEHFEARREELSEESLVRLGKNPLRILDSKDPRDRPAADSAPEVDAFLNDASRDFFERVTAGLDAAGVSWTRNARLVRGIDYYRHTAFEFVTDRLGAQGAVIAGGRYDGLVEQLGGPPTPAVGWAGGIERLAMLIDRPAPDVPMIAVVPDRPELEEEAFQLLCHLRQNEISAVMAFRGNAKRRVEIARKSGAQAALFVRATDDPAQKLHLTQLAPDLDQSFLKRVQRALPEGLRGISGTVPQ